MATRHKWQYTNNSFPRKCEKCGVKEVIKATAAKKPGLDRKVDRVFHQFPKGSQVEGNAPACTG